MKVMWYENGQTTLCYHAVQTKYIFDFDNTSVTAYEHSRGKRKIREIIDIRMALNFKTNGTHFTQFILTLLMGLVISF